MECRPRSFDSAVLFADIPKTKFELVPLLAGLFFVATGCSSSQQVSHTQSDGYARVTEAATGETARVHFRDGRTMKLDNLYVGPTSTTGVVPGFGQDQSFPTASIQKVELVDRGTGFIQGAGIGMAVPLASGILVSATQDEDFIPTWVIGAVLSVPTGLVGGIIGAIRGQRDTYHFSDSPEPRSRAIKNSSHVSREPSRK